MDQASFALYRFERGDLAAGGILVMKEINPNIHHFARETISRSKSSFIVAKGSPLKEVFWRPLRALFESGLLDKIKKNAINGKQGSEKAM